MIVGVFVLRGLGSYVSEYGLAWIGSRVVYDLRCEASDHLLRLPTTFYDASSAGYLLSKVTFDAQQVASTASEAITVAIRNTLTIAFMLAYLLWMNWQLTLIAFAAFPLVGYRDPADQQAGEARERAGAAAHRRADPCAGGGDRRAPGGQGLRRRGLRELAAARRRGQAAPRDGQAVGRCGAGHADQPDHRLHRGRRDPVGRDPPERRRPVRRRGLRHLHLRAAAPAQPGEDAGQRDHRHPARPDRRRERVRADRRDAGSRHRHRHHRARARRHPLRARDQALPRRRGAGARRRGPRHRARGVRRAGRPLRRRQDDAGQPDSAVLPAVRPGASGSTGRTSRRSGSPTCAGRSRW